MKTSTSKKYPLRQRLNLVPGSERSGSWEECRKQPPVMGVYDIMTGLPFGRKGQRSHGY